MADEAAKILEEGADWHWADCMLAHNPRIVMRHDTDVLGMDEERCLFSIGQVKGAYDFVRASAKAPHGWGVAFDLKSTVPKLKNDWKRVEKEVQRILESPAELYDTILGPVPLAKIGKMDDRYVEDVCKAMIESSEEMHADTAAIMAIPYHIENDSSTAIVVLLAMA